MSAMPYDAAPAVAAMTPTSASGASWSPSSPTMIPTPAKPRTIAAIRRGVGAWWTHAARMIAVHSGVVALMIEPRPAVSDRSA